MFLYMFSHRRVNVCSRCYCSLQDGFRMLSPGRRNAIVRRIVRCLSRRFCVYSYAASVGGSALILTLPQSAVLRLFLRCLNRRFCVYLLYGNRRTGSETFCAIFLSDVVSAGTQPCVWARCEDGLLDLTTRALGYFTKFRSKSSFRKINSFVR